MQAMTRTSSVTLSLAIFCFVALAVGAVANPVKFLPDGIHRVALSIPDMECAACCSNIRVELGRVKGVRGVKVDDAHRIVIVRFDPAQTSVKALQDAIRKANLDSAPIDEPNHP